MSNNTGGPAFPHEYFDKQLNQERVIHGMTLRDYFAAKAMQSILIDPRNESDSYDIDARCAYIMADAMLRAREA
jgi:hypothetical protein